MRRRAGCRRLISVRFIAAGAGLPDALSGAFSIKEVGSALLVFAGGAVLAAGLAMRPPPLPVGQAVFALARPPTGPLTAGVMGNLI